MIHLYNMCAQGVHMLLCNIYLLSPTPTYTIYVYV